MAATPRADLVFTGGRIWTGVERRRPEDTLVVLDGRIAAIGPADELGWAIGSRTRVIPLRGRLLLPAFHDGAVRPISAGLASGRCDLVGASDLAGALDRTRAWADAHPEAPWVLGDGWTTETFSGAPPRAADLDRIVPDRPAFLLAADGSAAWVNSPALALAGIGADTPDPTGGWVQRGAEGDPTGLLVGRAVRLVGALVPAPTSEALVDALQRSQAHLHAQGVGGWRDDAVEPAEAAAYLALDARGELHARASLSLRWDDRRWLEQIPELLDRRERIAEMTEGRVRAPSVTLVQDGTLGTATAAVLEPYLDGQGAAGRSRGQSLHPPDALREICVALDRERISVHVHAAGDRAVREALDALTAARRLNGPRDARHVIHHLGLVHPSDVIRFEPLGAIVGARPGWIGDEARWRRDLVPLLGPARMGDLHPYGSLARSRATLALGSAWPALPADPRRVLDAAIHRLDRGVPGARPLGPAAERLTPEVALRAATRGAAFASWFDDLTGTLEVGRSADLVVLDRDPLKPGAGTWLDANVLLTMVDGRVVHEAPGLDG